MTIKLIVATPVDGDATTGQVAVGYATALATLYRSHAVEMVPTQLTYSYDIARARNRVAAMVLREMPTATHVLWWDSDVVPHDMSVISAMIATGHDVVCAPYLRKRHPLTWTHQGLPTARMTGTCEEVWAVPFGFTITSVDCLRRMSDAHSDLAYQDVRTDGSAHGVVGLFNLAWSTDDATRALLSEDYSFCKRWRSMGGKVYVYCGEGNVLSHVGAHAWTPGVK